MEDTLSRSQFAVVSIQVATETVDGAIQEYDDIVQRAIQVAKEDIADFLESVPADMTKLTLPDDLATCVLDIWAAQYSFRDTGGFWHTLGSFASMLLSDTDWYVDELHTTEPNLSAPNDKRVVIPLHRLGTY